MSLSSAKAQVAALEDLLPHHSPTAKEVTMAQKKDTCSPNSVAVLDATRIDLRLLPDEKLVVSLLLLIDTHSRVVRRLQLRIQSK